MVSAGAATATALLQVSGLSFAWQGGKTPLLQIDNLTIKPGERIFIHGPSGCGKSSLLGLLGGVLLPQAGSIELAGADLTQMPARQRERSRVDHTGFIFQQFNLIPYLGVLANVLLPCQFSPRRAARASASDGSPRLAAQRLLAALGLDDDAHRRPVTLLSVGQQQRVAAARALIGSPELVLADEPTSALDADTQEVFLRLLFDECARANSALLFVSHDQRLAGQFQRRLDLPALNRLTRAAGVNA